jgi:putative hemolysin
VVTVITYASLIIGELVPKQVALRDPELVAVRGGALHDDACDDLIAGRLAARSVRQALLWLLGQRGEAQGRKSARMKSHLVVEAENAGVLEPGEKEMIAGVMRLGDLPVGAVMTPRREVSMINLTDDLQAVRSALAASSHSRFVVFDPAADAAVGIVNAKDMLDCYLSERDPDVGKLVRPAPIIPEFLDARDVVAILRDSAVHMGLVHDEYGAFQGVVTSADILESIVGGFHTEEGPPEAAAVKRDDGSYLISGWMPAVEFASLLRFECRCPVTTRPLQAFCSAISAGYPMSAIRSRQKVGASRSSISMAGASTRCWLPKWGDASVRDRTGPAFSLLQ